MKNKALNSFYEKLLNDVGIQDGGEGKLSIAKLDGVLSPVTVDGKRLTLPTRENLKSNDGGLIMFHPASEQLMSGPSPVLDALREYIMVRIYCTGIAIARSAMAISLDTSLQKKVRGAGNELMRALTSSDKRMSETLDRVLDNIGLTPDNRMYNIFLVASGSKENPRGLRTSKVSFPILDDANSDDTTEFFNVKMPRKTKDKPCITALLAAILDVDLEKEHLKEYTSTLRQAPYFHSLITAFHDIATHQNKLIDSLSKADKDIKGLEYNLDWTEEFDDFENFVKKVGHAVPLLPGNQGKLIGGSDNEEEEEEKTTGKPKASTKSWRDMRDAISEEPGPEEELHRGREVRANKSTWRDRFAPQDSSSGGTGISFGGRSRDRSRGGFRDMTRDERDDSRGWRSERNYRNNDRPRSWRDISGYRR